MAVVQLFIARSGLLRLKSTTSNYIAQVATLSHSEIHGGGHFATFHRSNFPCVQRR
jgi:hypothetical protein